MLLVLRHDFGYPVVVGVETMDLGHDRGGLLGRVATSVHAQQCTARKRLGACACYGEAMHTAERTIARSASANGFWSCALCTRPSFVIVHYLRVTVWNTVHGHCSFKKKKKYPRDLGHHTFLACCILVNTGNLCLYRAEERTSCPHHLFR